jgi:acyl-coenzyme A synthetase/AMP-(fatty) acid ligase
LVADAAVVGEPDSKWGEVVVACVVPASDVGDLESELDSWAQENLVDYKRPRRWRVVETIPRNALGKILRHQL